MTKETLQKRLTVRISDDLAKKINNVSKKMGINISKLTNKALLEFIERYCHK